MIRECEGIKLALTKVKEKFRMLFFEIIVQLFEVQALILSSYDLEAIVEGLVEAQNPILRWNRETVPLHGPGVQYLVKLVFNGICLFFGRFCDVEVVVKIGVD